MMDLSSIAALSLSGLAAISILSFAGLKAWHEWIEYKKGALGQEAGASREPAAPSAFNRIEVADLKERIRKLEAIAAGVDL